MNRTLINVTDTFSIVEYPFFIENYIFEFNNLTLYLKNMMKDSGNDTMSYH